MSIIQFIDQHSSYDPHTKLQPSIRNPSLAMMKEEDKQQTIKSSPGDNMPNTSFSKKVKSGEKINNKKTPMIPEVVY